MPFFFGKCVQGFKSLPRRWRGSSRQKHGMEFGGINPGLFRKKVSRDNLRHLISSSDDDGRGEAEVPEDLRFDPLRHSRGRKIRPLKINVPALDVSFDLVQ